MCKKTYNYNYTNQLVLISALFNVPDLQNSFNYNDTVRAPNDITINSAIYGWKNPKMSTALRIRLFFYEYTYQ